MAYATVVLDGIYSKNEVNELVKNIDYRVGWFKWDDVLNVEVKETFTITVKYKSSDGKYLYYFAKNPSIDKVTVAIIRGYNPVVGLWSQELNDEAKREFYNQLNNIDNIVLVLEKLTRNKSEILDKLNSKGLLIKKQIYVPPPPTPAPAPKPAPKPAPTPAPTIPGNDPMYSPEFYEPGALQPVTQPKTATDINNILSNPTTLMLIGGVLLILILIMKK